jgi:cytohesin
MAVATGDAGRLGELILKDPDLLDRTWYYHPSSKQTSLLHLAAITGQVESIVTLIQLGANPLDDDGDGASALFRAAENGHMRAVQELLKHDTRINQATTYGWTPLLAAACREHTSIVRFLLEKGARYDLTPAIVCGDLARVQQLISSEPSLLKKKVSRNRPLDWAAVRGHTTIAKWLINQGAEINWRTDGDDDSALQQATWRGYEEIVRLLIDTEADLEFGSGECYGTALHRAVWQGHKGIVKMLLKAGADIEAVDNTDETPLAFAAKRGHLELAQLLLDAGARVDGNGKRTPLQTAIWVGNVPLTKLLLERGADLALARCDDGAALYMAAERGYVEMVELLLRHDPNLTLGDTGVLHAAVQCRDMERYENYFTIVRLLIDKGCSPNAVWHGRFSISYAKSTRMMKHLLACGADPKARTKDGETALHMTYDAEKAKVLLDAGADIDAVDNKGNTPLHEAIARSDIDWYAAVRDVLLAHGAKVDPFAAAMLGRTADVFAALKHDPGLARQAGPGGNTLLGIAAGKGLLPLVTELVRLGAEIENPVNRWTPLHSAAGSGHAEVVAFLARNGANVDTPCDYQQRPLFTAAMGGHAGVIRVLINHGADINARTTWKRSALMAAAEKGFLDTVRALVDAGAKDINSAFRGALSHGRNDVALCLLGKGADPKGVPGEYTLPLHEAATSCSNEVIRALVEAGADVNATNEGGATPLDRAKGNGKYEAVRTLRVLGGLQAHQVLQLRAGKVKELIPLLDDERFAVRQHAFRQLRSFGGIIADLLRSARDETDSTQVRAHLDELLEQCAPRQE